MITHKQIVAKLSGLEALIRQLPNVNRVEELQTGIAVLKAENLLMRKMFSRGWANPRSRGEK